MLLSIEKTDKQIFKSMFEKLFKSQQALNWITWLTFAAVLVLLMDSYRKEKLLKFNNQTPAA